MAKKSARSKGYRRQSASKPYLSRREIIVLCVLVAIVAAAAVVLFRYDDGALKVKDGAVVTGGDNWVIVNGSNARGRARYFKLGEAGDVAGYRRETNPALADPNVTEFYYYPEDESAPIDYLTVGASHAPAATLANSVAAAMASLDGYEVGALTDGEAGGLAYRYFAYTAESAADAAQPDGDADGEADAAQPDGDADTATEADAAEDAAEEARYSQAMNAYIDAGHDSCVVVHAINTAEDPDGYLPEAELKAALDAVIGALALEAG